LFLHSSLDTPPLPSFPTRRSSDLNALPMKTAAGTLSRKRFPACGRITVTPVRISLPRTILVCPTFTPATSVIASSGPRGNVPLRSEEHTSELQSLRHLVCRLLLEK